MLANGNFNQNQLNAFVWSFHPELNGTPMTNEWLYSEEADDLYFDDSSLPEVLAHNEKNTQSEKIGLGTKMSQFEMETLLLGVLGQPITLTDSPTKKIQAILVRDIHDLYKYGIIPAHVEEQMQAADLLNFPVVQL